MDILQIEIERNRGEYEITFTYVTYIRFFRRGWCNFSWLLFAFEIDATYLKQKEKKKLSLVRAYVRYNFSINLFFTFESISPNYFAVIR